MVLLIALFLYIIFSSEKAKSFVSANRLNCNSNWALLIFTALLPQIVSGQIPATYNLNKNNGLSTNHIYTTIADKHGYLWIGTDEGVFCYNGYSLKRYGYADGLLNTDVWDLYIDYKGRIWTLSISEGIGYFQNGTYKQIAQPSDSIMQRLYPTGLAEFGDSILLYDNTHHRYGTSLIIIKNDSLFRIAKSNYNDYLKSNILGRTLLEFLNDTLKAYSLDNWVKNIPSRTFFLPGFGRIMAETTVRGAFSTKYIFASKRDGDKIYIFNLINYSTDTLFTGSKTNPIEHCYPENNKFYVLTRDSFYIFDSSLRLTSVISPGKFIRNLKPNTSYTYVYTDTFWGLSISTDKSGLFINNRDGHYYSNNAALDGYSFSGYINDTIGAWWNNKDKMMAYVCNGRIIAQQSIQADNHLKVSHVGNDKNMMLNALGAYWLSPYNEPVNFSNKYDSTFYLGKIEKTNKGHHVLWYIRDAVFIDSNTMFLARGSVGVDKIKLLPEKSFVYCDHLSDDSYDGVVYNKRHKVVVCYYDHSILIFNLQSNTRITLNNRQLAAIGIRGIERIYSDDYGNFFIKDYDNLFVFNWQQLQLKKLYRNLSMQKSFVHVSNNTLYAAGSFGIVKSAITGPGTIDNTTIFPNTKHVFYNYITDVQFGTSKVLLKTDLGQYTVDMGQRGSNNIATSCKTVFTLADTFHCINSNDTVTLDPAIESIAFDVINPTGTGQLHNQYSINGSDYNNTGQQIILPKLAPGSYNIISLISFDDSWRSKPLLFTIYIQPEWWQTQTAKRAIFVLSLLAFIGFVYLVIVMTRRIVNNNNERRNQRRELELKSIYSQINPHFIFNSLSTAQYFVKKNQNKEAFEHINQFSDLLRAYIKSSRAKYITIAEEIENLENYLELQLTRFEEKFDYTIDVDKSVNPDKVKIPSLLLQPLVENALNHGIFHSEHKGTLNISFSIDEQDKNTLVCIVDDDGIGRQKSKELRGKIIRKADSYGTILIKELIDTFNKYEKINIEIEYIDKQLPDTGTTVVVRIRNYAEIL